MVTKLPTVSWLNVFHFTANNRNMGKHGDRIPALFINRHGYFHIVSSVNDKPNYWKNFNFELGKTYKITIQQTKIGSKYWYEIILNGDSMLRVENKNPLEFSDVHLYESDPWYDSFSADFGSICNVNIDQDM